MYPLLPDYRIRQRDYLLQIARALTQELNPDKLLARILNFAVEMLSGQAGLIALKDENGKWKIAVAQGTPESFIQRLEPLLAEIPEIDDADQSEIPELNRLLQNITRIASLNMLSGVGLPLIAYNQAIGLIFIFRRYQGRFSANDRTLLQSFADQAAIAVHNAQLYSNANNEKQRLSTLLDSAADAILIINPDNTIALCNQAFVRLFGIGDETQVVGRNHSQIIKFSDRIKGTTLEEAEAGGWPLNAEATLYVEGDMLLPNSMPLPVGIRYASAISEDGALINIIATIRDITEFREAEELKSTFISIISHELRTPVALIKGYVGTLRREDVSWDRQIVEDSLEVIEEEADRLTDLIDNLLDASRLQAGGLSVNRSDLNLQKFIEKSIEKQKLQLSHHKVIVNIPDDLPVILADENRLFQVIDNLLSNAVKYSPEGGEIVIYASSRPREIIICIKDQGPGFSPDDVPFVFDRFYRSKDATRKTKGAGLGLYLTKAIIESHGGRIWIDPKVESGAKICFSLPRD